MSITRQVSCYTLLVGLVAERLVREFAQGMPFDPPYRTRLFEGADRLGQDCRPWQRWL